MQTGFDIDTVDAIMMFVLNSFTNKRFIVTIVVTMITMCSMLIVCVLLSQWREASYTTMTSSSSSSSSSSAGQVLRVYTVCTVLGLPRPSTTRPINGSSSASVSAAAGDAAVVDNWLRTPWIAVQDAGRVYVDVEYSMRQCPPGDVDVYSRHQRQRPSSVSVHASTATTPCTYRRTLH